MFFPPVFSLGRCWGSKPPLALLACCCVILIYRIDLFASWCCPSLPHHSCPHSLQFKRYSCRLLGVLILHLACLRDRWVTDPISTRKMLSPGGNVHIFGGLMICCASDVLQLSHNACVCFCISVKLCLCLGPGFFVCGLILSL